MCQIKESIAVAAAITLAAASGAATAAEPAICAVEQAISCAPFEPCSRSLPGAVNLPVLMRLDPAASVVVSRLEDGTERRSEVASVTNADTTVTLQGMDEGRPWLIQIDSGTGRFSLASAHPGVTFSAFGVCSTSLLK
jgi:hypothetical protein